MGSRNIAWRIRNRQRRNLAPDCGLIDFGAIGIDDYDIAITFTDDIDGNLSRDILCDVPCLGVIGAIDANRIFQSKSIDDLEMIFWHCSSPILRKAMRAGEGCSGSTGAGQGSEPYARIGNKMVAYALHHRREDIPMTVLFERIVQKIADAAPIENMLENTVSDLVASVLEKTANKLVRFEAPAEQDAPSEEAA
jgi:hypothetical protein